MIEDTIRTVLDKHGAIHLILPPEYFDEYAEPEIKLVYEILSDWQYNGEDKELKAQLNIITKQGERNA